MVVHAGVIRYALGERVEALPLRDLVQAGDKGEL